MGNDINESLEAMARVLENTARKLRQLAASDGCGRQKATEAVSLASFIHPNLRLSALVDAACIAGEDTHE